MKKVLLILITILLLTGCSSKNETTEEIITTKPVVDKKEKLTEAENILLNYGKLIYENDTWTKGNVQVMTYHMSLKEMQDINKYDISMFINPETGKQCDLEKTKIEFVVKSSTSTKTEYSFNPVVVCE